MKTVPVLNFQQFISADGESLTTDSRKVTAVHGKRHDDVLRLIRKRVSESGEWGLRNFAESSYFNEQGKLQPMFTMTKNGYAFLVGKMSGRKAVEHQIAFIEAFDAMAAYIKNQREGLQFQYFKKEVAYTTRKTGVSASARDMRSWQDDKPAMLIEMDAILSKMQPSLIN
jgi:Rha family phage regulatory protein